MFNIQSPTFSQLKCPHLDSCPFGPANCVFSHDPSVYVKGGLDGRIGLSSMTYFKDLQKRMRAEENACKESNLFSGLNVSAGTKDAALESDLSKFLHRAPTGTKISMSLREKVLLKLIKSLRQIDAGSTLGRAAEIEAELLRAAGNVSSVYLSSVSEYIKRCGVEGIKKETNGEFKVTYDDLYGIVAGNEMLKEYSYPLSLYPEQSADSLVGLFESVKGCRRCGVPFIPAKYYSDDAGNRSGVCRYHSEKPERIGGLRVYGCCQAPVGDNNGCCTFEWHVFKGYKRGDPLPRYEQLNNPMVGRTAVALDAEMFYTVGGYEVSRVTLIDFFTETTLLDVLVLPRCPPVLDYNTKWSGVSAELYEGGGGLEVMEFEAMKGRLREFIGEETILIGHSLDNDLLVLEFHHKLIVDTAILYPHPSRPPYRMSLKKLALGHLSALIQQSVDGHDSKEDCLTCIKLIKNYFYLQNNKMK